MAGETENRRLELERVHAGVAALVADAAKGIYYLAELAATRTVAGQLLITYEWSDWRNGNFWWIQSVYVAEPFRGRGIFRALFNHVHRLAQSRPDVCGLRLYMDTMNSPARQVYQQLGFATANYEFFEIDFVLGAHKNNPVT